MKSFDEFGVENCNLVLMEERPCQNRKQLKNREGEYIENDKSRLSGCLVGLEWNITMPQESITLKKRKDAKYSNREH